MTLRARLFPLVLLLGCAGIQKQETKSYAALTWDTLDATFHAYVKRESAAIQAMPPGPEAQARAASLRTAVERWTPISQMAEAALEAWQAGEDAPTELNRILKEGQAVLTELREL